MKVFVAILECLQLHLSYSRRCVCVCVMCISPSFPLSALSLTPSLTSDAILSTHKSYPPLPRHSCTHSASTAPHTPSSVNTPVPLSLSLTHSLSLSLCRSPFALSLSRLHFCLYLISHSLVQLSPLSLTLTHSLTPRFGFPVSVWEFGVNARIWDGDVGRLRRRSEGNVSDFCYLILIFFYFFEFIFFHFLNYFVCLLAISFLFYSLIYLQLCVFYVKFLSKYPYLSSLR